MLREGPPPIRKEYEDMMFNGVLKTVDSKRFNLLFEIVRLEIIPARCKCPKAL